MQTSHVGHKIAGNEIKQQEAREAAIIVVSSQGRHLSKNHSKKSVWGKFLASILIPYLSSQPAEFQPEERIIRGAPPLGTPVQMD